MSEYRRDLEIEDSVPSPQSPSVQIQFFVKSTTALAIKTLEDPEGLYPLVTLDGVGASRVTMHFEDPASVERLRDLLSKYLLMVAAAGEGS